MNYESKQIVRNAIAGITIFALFPYALLTGAFMGVGIVLLVEKLFGVDPIVTIFIIAFPAVGGGGQLAVWIPVKIVKFIDEKRGKKMFLTRVGEWLLNENQPEHIVSLTEPQYLDAALKEQL